MVEELITNILNTTINSFDFPFCITVNIATYLIVKGITDVVGNNILSIWKKRFILLLVSITVGVFYCFNGSDYRTIFNSIILAPVAWSWIFKPICAKLKIDYDNKSEDK